MTEIIFCGTPKRASTLRRRVRSTELNALVRSIKHTYNGIRFFLANFCSRRITIISVVKRFGRTPLCSSGKIPTRSQYSREAASVGSFFLWSTMTITYFHRCDTSPPLQIQTTISSSLRRRAGSPLRVILNSSAPPDPTAFPFANERMPSVSSCVVG